MGGYGSGRWGYGGSSRPHTDPLLFLDIRYLARNRFLEAADGERRWNLLSWTNRSTPSGSVLVGVIGAGERFPDHLSLRYVAGDAQTPVHEDFALETTPCPYGGERVWLECPGCLTRRAKLYSVGGLFRCRTCNDVVYTSTRETCSDRQLRRADTTRSKLGGGPGAVWDAPPKPRGMHWKTYSRLAADLEDQGLEMMLEMTRSLEALDRRLSRHQRAGAEPNKT